MELLILAFFIVLNGVFAMSEMAVVSARKARLQQWTDEGRAGAAAALELANNPANFLSTIQVGITTIGILSGAFGEATIAKALEAWLRAWPALVPYAEEVALVIVVAGITIASLIVGELIPKRLALLSPEAIASAIAKPMRVLARLTHPLVSTLSAITEGALRLVGIRGTGGAPVSEEEINVLMAQGAKAGIFEAHEQALVERVFRLDELRVTGVMTPRADVVSLDLDAPLEVNLRRIVESGYSRFPAIRGGVDRVEGVLQTKTLFEDAVSGRPIDLAARLAKPLYLPDTLTVMQVVESFKKHRQTMALVVNEFGELQGVVTLNDVMEALVGDIATVEDAAELDVVRRDDGSWLVDGSVTVERFKDVVGLDVPLPEERSGGYYTLGGFAMLQLGRVPNVGDRFDWGGLRFEIVDMDRNRVDKLIVAPLPAPPGAAAPRRA
jgi:putative hemolysin